MRSPRKGSPSGPNRGRALAVGAALAMGWVLPMTGCQVEYAGMTLPSGKYMHDDVQYFPPGPDFPWANTQAATQRARMQAMGMDVTPLGQGGPTVVPPAAGVQPPVQNQLGRPADVNVSPLNNEGPIPVPGAVPGVPAPGIPGGAAVPPPAAGEAVTPPGPDLGPK